MISPYMVVDGLTWSDVTGPGTVGRPMDLKHILSNQQINSNIACYYGPQID